MTAMVETVTDKRFVMDGYLYTHRGIKRDLTGFENRVRSLNSVNAEQATRLTKWFETAWYFIEHHHKLEDDQFFPVLASRVPELTTSMQVLTADHHELDELVEVIRGLLARTQTGPEVVRELARVAGIFNAKMFDHLDREEKIVIPAVAENASVEEQRATEQELFKTTPKERLALMMPWIVSVLNDQERQAMFKDFPFIARLLFRFSFKPKYDRLVASYRF